MSDNNIKLYRFGSEFGVAMKQLKEHAPAAIYEKVYETSMRLLELLSLGEKYIIKGMKMEELKSIDKAIKASEEQLEKD